MGASADDRMTTISFKKAAGKNYYHASDETIDNLVTTAEDLAVTDNMPLAKAVEIISEQSRLPYGSLKK